MITIDNFYKARVGLDAYGLEVDHWEVNPLTELPDDMPYEPGSPEDPMEGMCQPLVRMQDRPLKIYVNAAVPLDVIRGVSRFGRWFDSFEEGVMDVDVLTGPIKTVRVGPDAH